MIPWPSSRYDSRSTAAATDKAAAATDKELKFLRNQSGHIKNLLEAQGVELKEQRQLLQSVLDAIKVPRDLSCASPMYVFRGEA